VRQGRSDVVSGESAEFACVLLFGLVALESDEGIAVTADFVVKSRYPDTQMGAFSRALQQPRVG
jgi:hypothetical protein